MEVDGIMYNGVWWVWYSDMIPGMGSGSLSRSQRRFLTFWEAEPMPKFSPLVEPESF